MFEKHTVCSIKWLRHGERTGTKYWLRECTRREVIGKSCNYVTKLWLSYGLTPKLKFARVKMSVVIRMAPITRDDVEQRRF